MNPNRRGHQKLGWQSLMINAGFWLIAAAFAAGTTVILWGGLIRWHFGIAVGVGLSFLIFVALIAALYVVLKGVFFEVPTELRKNVQISSKELRRRRKQYFDNLPK